MLNLLISQAFAEGAENIPASTTNGEMSPTSLIPIILVFFIFYFFVIRPQNKKIKEHKNFISDLKIGTKIITNGGIIGTIRKVKEESNEVEIEISDGVLIKIIKDYIISPLENKETSEKSQKSQLVKKEKNK